MTWQVNAGCVDTDPALFFEDEPEYDEKAAKQVCAGCEVVNECATEAFLLSLEPRFHSHRGTLAACRILRTQRHPRRTI